MSFSMVLKPTLQKDGGSAVTNCFSPQFYRDIHLN